ncbi:Hyaluronan synthase [Hartmannibacter diazotrophicus]|uniref:Hyaluronan synthase n=1 Tax=Hartmannibacter diazotrophicus TaxID=1482074 RepID=A0A2C9D031_9HYPH|nr:glycosyltransferase [Hartmannibacter diazotrophicus]SON53692.1 Hyaluronan synthase [Hartmannibacter diazotrophicus]
MKLQIDLGKYPNIERLLYSETETWSDDAAVLADRIGRQFDERSYLFTNPDIRVAVEAGHIESGYEHWLRHGQAEGRIGTGVSRYCNRLPWSPRVDLERPRVLFYGPVSATSGLGNAARGYAAALALLDIELEVVDSTAAIYPHLKMEIKPHTIDPDIVIVDHNADALNNFFGIVDKSILDNAYTIGIWVWELASFRNEWIEQFSAFDEIWSLSRFSLDAIATIAPPGVTLGVVPCVVEEDVIETTFGRSHFSIPEDAFVFLCVFDVSSVMERKNPYAAIDAFKAAFADDPSVVLVLKYHSQHAAPEKIEAMRAAATAPNILIIDSVLSAEENAALKLVVDCIVSPHRSEGFGFNVAEAMLVGKPVICTNYSSTLDFTSPDNAFLIDCKMVEVDLTEGPYPHGFLWADPDREHIASLMKAVRQGGPDVQRRIERAREDVLSTLSRRAVGEIMDGFISRICESRSAFRNLLNLERRKGYVWRHPRALGHYESLPDDRDWPLISVIVPVYNIQRGYLLECVNSVLGQSYPFWELCLCNDASTLPETIELLEELRGKDQRIKIRNLSANVGISRATNAAVEIATGKYVAFLDNDDTIHPDALRHYAEATILNPDADAFYCDEDKINSANEYVEHYFKPDWSPEHLESCMYVLHMIMVRKSVFVDLEGYREEYTGAQDYDLLLRLSLGNRKIVHIPEVLYHWRIIEGSAAAEVAAKPTALNNARRALEAYAKAKYGPEAFVTDGKLFGLFRVCKSRTNAPPVTLVMTTNNSVKDVEHRGRINLAVHLLQSILEKTDYPSYSVLMVTNGTFDEEGRRLLQESGGREVAYEGDQKNFNFADKANFAITSASTELVVLLNDDMEIRSSDWLWALVDLIQDEGVGAVGARLTYPTNHFQHVGMVLGVNETAAHIYHGHDESTVGYNGYPNIIRNYSAVTGACMATKLSLFKEVGGFDTAFATDFNDTDYCLKLRAKGYRVVYTPFAELYHFESQTAVRSSQSPKEKELFLSRWSEVIANDPYYNRNLRRNSITFEPLEDAWPV